MCCKNSKSTVPQLHNAVQFTLSSYIELIVQRMFLQVAADLGSQLLGVMLLILMSILHYPMKLTWLLVMHMLIGTKKGIEERRSIAEMCFHSITLYNGIKSLEKCGCISLTALLSIMGF